MSLTPSSSNISPPVSSISSIRIPTIPTTPTIVPRSTSVSTLPVSTPASTIPIHTSVTTPVSILPKPLTNETLPLSSPVSTLSSTQILPSQYQSNVLSDGIDLIDISPGQSQLSDYSELLARSNIERELINNGYSPLNRISIYNDSTNEIDRQYIKSINSIGQPVYILIDNDGYAPSYDDDISLMETKTVNNIPYSFKTGAYACTDFNVCGIAFECGPDSVCILLRDENEIDPKEYNYISINGAENDMDKLTDDVLTPYPVIRLSEIRENPDLILSNSNTVTRRLRNRLYSTYLNELDETQKSIDALDVSFHRFADVISNVSEKLNRTVSQLEEWNNFYLSHPPTTDIEKDKYRKIRYNLIQRNHGILYLLRVMNRIVDINSIISSVVNDIDTLTSVTQNQFKDIDYVLTE